MYQKVENLQNQLQEQLQEQPQESRPPTIQITLIPPTPTPPQTEEEQEHNLPQDLHINQEKKINRDHPHDPVSEKNDQKTEDNVKQHNNHCYDLNGFRPAGTFMCR